MAKDAVQWGTECLSKFYKPYDSSVGVIQTRDQFADFIAVVGENGDSYSRCYKAAGPKFMLQEKRIEELQRAVGYLAQSIYFLSSNTDLAHLNEEQLGMIREVVVAFDPASVAHYDPSRLLIILGGTTGLGGIIGLVLGLSSAIGARNVPSAILRMSKAFGLGLGIGLVSGMVLAISTYNYAKKMDERARTAVAQNPSGGTVTDGGVPPED